METVSSKLQEVHRDTINQLKKLEDVKRLREPDKPRSRLKGTVIS